MLQAGEGVYPSPVFFLDCKYLRENFTVTNRQEKFINL